MSKELRRRLQAVDPALTIVPGGHHKKPTRGETDWKKAAGITCTNCGQEVFRSRDGLCMRCWEDAHEIEVIDKVGITNWLPLSIIEQITHPSRKTPEQ